MLPLTGQSNQNPAVLERLRRLQAYLDQDPNNLNLLADLCDAALMAGNSGEARRAATRGLEISPGDTFFSLRLSSACLADRHFEESLGITQSIINAGHADPAVIQNHAYALVSLARFSEVRDILAPYPNKNGPLCKLLLRALHYLGEVDEAIMVANAYLAAVPDDLDISGMLCLLYVDQNRMDLAEPLVHRVLDGIPTHIDALLAAGTLALAREDAGKAERISKSAIALQPNNGRAWINLGLAAMLELDLPSARDAFRHASNSMPGHIGTWHLLGWTELILSELSAAEACFRQALEIDENFGETHGALATIAAMKGQWELAEEEAKIARRLDPDSMASYYPKVIKLQHEGHNEAANRIVERALRQGKAPFGGTFAEMIQRVKAKLPSQ